MNSCQYINQGSFTVVITPHAVDRARERDFTSKLPWFTLFNLLERDNRNQYVVISGFQCFLNKKYNTIRSRWELEVISFTPDNWTRKTDICILTVA